MIQSVHNLTPGDLFTTDGRDVWEIVSFCEHPTVTLKNVRTGETTYGAVGCRNLANFVPLRPAEPIIGKIYGGIEQTPDKVW
jgi:hypothetical protein